MKKGLEGVFGGIDRNECLSWRLFAVGLFGAVV